MSPPGLNRAQVLGTPLFCALIDFTAAIYKIQNPRKNAWVFKVDIWNRAKIRRYYLDEIR
jgi:hypothetical protein